jgi:hypothetical protein
VTDAVDHGLIWSIYFFDPNNIPLEMSWDIMTVTMPPAVADDDPLDIVAEGADAQPGHWPEVTNPTPPEQMVAHGGNGLDMREATLREGRGHLRQDYARLAGGTSEAAE